MNSVALAGRLVANTELKTTPNGKMVTNFTIAVQRDKETTYFIDCVAWSKTAETINKNIHKGEMLGIEGELQTRTYTDNSGKNHKRTEVQVKQITFLQPKAKEEPNDNPFIEEEIGDLPF
jgi:single-strand DNA-binding protein